MCYYYYSFSDSVLNAIKQLNYRPNSIAVELASKRNANVAIIVPEINYTLSAGLIILARVLGFIRFAPILNRKDINTIVKLSLAFLLTLMKMNFIPL